MSTDFIPLVDLEPWFVGTDDDRLMLAETVDAHLRRCGFLVVVNHGIDPTVFERMRTTATDFFHQPPSAKELVMPDGGGLYRGWIGPGRESNAATYGIDTPPDLKETFAFGTIEDLPAQTRATSPELYADNLWPDDPASFRSIAETYWTACRRLADDLLELFALALGLDRNEIVDHCQETTATGNVNWYWPHRHGAAEPGQYRIGPHTDFGTITILDRQPGLGGLQVKDDDDRWIDAPVVDGSLIVNTGDMLRQWTNDRWCSNEHRVLPPSPDAPEEELISLVFFHEPDADAVIEPFPTCVSAAVPARYEPILAKDYLAEKFAALEVGSSADRRRRHRAAAGRAGDRDRTDGDDRCDDEGRR
ncbi:MAG: 2-oxoglutarate and iron-dependent oxygenase domain-containing protein [Actinomycetota bacterium]